MQHKTEGRVLLLGLFLVCQLLVVAIYIWSGTSQKQPLPIRYTQPVRHAYLSSEIDTILLPTNNVSDYFVLVNGSSCFRHGTDFRRRAHGGKCECLPGHHGNDCSLPEVIWRAFIASRHGAIITRRPGVQRHIILVSDGSSPNHQATQLNELKHVVDLFVVPNVHDRKFIKGIENKVLVGQSWRSAIRNLQLDALILHVPAHVIPLPAALLFLKLFDGFPQPIRFRLKWNVYGYYFQHPNRTRVYPEGDAAFTVGDLNHYGGWYCDLCSETLNTTMQDVVGDGLYSDRKTFLLQAHSNQPYFAPEFLLNNSWQFDSLLTNFYSKFDYN